MKFLFCFLLAFAMAMLCSVDVQAGQSESELNSEKSVCLTAVAVEKQMVIEVLLTKSECGLRSIACIQSFGTGKLLAVCHMEKRCFRISRGKNTNSSLDDRSPNYLINIISSAMPCQPYRLQTYHMRC